MLLAWALYVFLAPVDRNLPVLTAWFRLVYAAIAMVALLNLLTVRELTGGAEYLAAYVPSLIGVLLMVAGAGYLVDSHLKPLLFPTADTTFLVVTYFGELVFLGWLLWRGWRVELPLGPGR